MAHILLIYKKSECIFKVSGQVKSVCSSLTFQIGGIVCGVLEGDT